MSTTIFGQKFRRSSLTTPRAREPAGAAPSSGNICFAGLLVSERGNRFIPMHATKGSRRCRYYVEEVPRPSQTDAARLDSVRIPASEIETATVQTITGFLKDGGELLRQLSDLSPDQARAAVKAGHEIGAPIGGRGTAQNTIVRSLVRRVIFRPDALRIELTGADVRRALNVGSPSVDDYSADHAVRRTRCSARI